MAAPIRRPSSAGAGPRCTTRAPRGRSRAPARSGPATPPGPRRRTRPRPAPTGRRRTPRGGARRRRPCPRRARRSPAYSRIVSSMPNRELAVDLGAPQQALVRQRRQPVQRLDAEVARRIRDRVGGLDACTRRRRPTSGRTAPARARQQAVAPVDRRAQRPLALGQVARPAVSIGSCVRSRSRISSSDRSFTRLAASSIASGSPSSRAQISATSGRGRVVQPEPGIRQTRAIGEQRDRLGLADRAAVGEPAGRGTTAVRPGTPARRRAAAATRLRHQERAPPAPRRSRSATSSAPRRAPARSCRAPAAAPGPRGGPSACRARIVPDPRAPAARRRSRAAPARVGDGATDRRNMRRPRSGAAPLPRPGAPGGSCRRRPAR